MRIDRSIVGLGLAVLLGLGACGAEEEPASDAVVTEEVVTEPTTETVEMQVPAVDTSVIRTEMEVDTTIDTEVIEDPAIEQRDPN